MSAEAYHLIPLGMLILGFYALSLLLVRLSITSRKQNRRIWNFILLFFFLSTSLLGLVLVIKVNYKLDLPWIEEALQWHVDCGIGFSLVAVFHLLWNFSYYTRNIGRETAGVPNPGPPAENAFTLSASGRRIFFFLLGYISIMAQLVLLRDYIMSFHGNELVIGIFLAAWMILTAMGSRAGNGYPFPLPGKSLFAHMTLLGGLPILIHLLLILEKRFLFLPGYQAGVLEMTLSIVFLTVLFAGISGFLFGYVSKNGSSTSRASAYRLDALGSLAGGVLFSLILVHLLNNLQQLTLLFLSTTLLVLWIFKYPEGRIMKWILPGAGALLFALSLVPGVLHSVEGLRYRQEKILRIRDTPHGNLTFTARNDQVTAYLDGNPLLSAADLTRTEESVHFPSLQHPDPGSFLLIGGGFSGQVREASKYRPERIDYCEADPWIYRLGQEYFPDTARENVHFIPRDGRSWLMTSADKQYDVVVSTAGDPVTLGWNRYFTLEFYKLVKQNLHSDGFFCMQLGAGGSYVNEEGSKLLGINYYTLKEVFSHVELIPGTSTYFIASDLPVSLDFPALLERHRIPTTYVHPDYLDAMQLLFDSDQLCTRIQTGESRINRDLRPVLFFASLSGLESRMGQHALGITGILASLLLVLLWVLYKPVKSAMYISGFTGAGMQMVLIMVMQSFYGFAYLVAPLMITAFMGGIVLGTLGWARIWSNPSVQGLTAMMLLLALLSALGFLFIKSGIPVRMGVSGQFMLGFLNLVTGAFIGAVFALSVHLKRRTECFNPGIIYSADLTGAALGTLLPVVFLLPLTGVLNTFILFCGINLITALRLFIYLKKRTDGQT